MIFTIDESGFMVEKRFQNGVSGAKPIRDKLPESAKLYHVEFKREENLVRYWFSDEEEIVHLQPVFKQIDSVEYSC